MNASNPREDHPARPNILILCMDQWDTRMELPDAVELPALRRLEAQGVTFDHQYCTAPICTPLRASMWTGIHAAQTGRTTIASSRPACGTTSRTST